MNGKQSKKARAAAWKEAERRGLWKKGDKELIGAKWWRPILAKLFPKIRARYMDAIGRWHKATIKGWAKQVAASIHDRDLAAFQRAQHRAQRRHAIAFARKWQTQGKEVV